MKRTFVLNVSLDVFAQHAFTTRERAEAFALAHYLEPALKRLGFLMLDGARFDACLAWVRKREAQEDIAPRYRLDLWIAELQLNPEMERA